MHSEGRFQSTVSSHEIFLVGDRDPWGDRDLLSDEDFWASLVLPLPDPDSLGNRDLPVFRVLDLSLVLPLPFSPSFRGSPLLGILPDRGRPLGLGFELLFGLGFSELLFSSVTSVMVGILAEFETCTRHMLT